MRLISLVLALAIIASLIVYYKDALLGPKHDPEQTVIEQSRQIIDNAKQTSDQMQKAMEVQQKQLEKYDQ